MGSVDGWHGRSHAWFDTFALILVQVVTIGIGSAVIAIGEGFGEVTGVVVFGVTATGVGCSALAFALSTWSQRAIEPERAGVINLVEPIVVGIVGYFVGERLGVAGYLGAGLIVAGIFVVERATHARTPFAPVPWLGRVPFRHVTLVTGS